MTNPAGKRINRYLALIGVTVLFSSLLAQTAAAEVVLFQDDTFQDVMSDALRIGSNDAGAVNTAIQFGNDVTATENGNVTWNIATNRFGFDHAVDVTGGLRSDDAVDIGGTNGLTGNSPASSRNILRKDSAPNTNAACSALGEVIVNTTSNRVEICTTTGVAGVAVWAAPTTTIASGATDPVVACSVGDLFYNTTSSLLKVCTAVTPTWTVVGPDTFETVYANDGDKILNTSGGNFGVSTGAGTFDVTTTTGKATITSGKAATNAIDLQATNAAGGINANWGTGGLNFSSATGAFSINGTGASTVNATSGNLNLTTTTTGDVALKATGAGKSVTFADVNVASPIKFSNTATALDGTFVAGAGILDAINSFASTTAGSGASNVGVASGLTNISGSDVQAALASIDGKIGASAPNVDTLTFNPQYPNYVISRSGSNNNGTLVQDFDSTNKKQYYRWTSNKGTLQNVDVKFRFPLPTDFTGTGNFTLAYRTGTVTTTDNKIDVTVTDVTKTNTVCGSGLTNASANAWATATITAATLNAGCTAGNAMAAGDLMEVDVTFYDLSGGTTWADAGQAALAYNN